jgi:hypothetical protein
MTETGAFPCAFANHVDPRRTKVLADHTLLNMIYISSESQSLDLKFVTAIASRYIHINSGASALSNLPSPLE